MTAKLLQAHDAEVSVLGTVMLDNASLDRVSGIVGPEHFYAPRHQVVARAMVDLRKAGQPVDPITLSAALERAGTLQQVGGIDYLMTLAEASAHAHAVEAHAQLVRDAADVRTLSDIMRAVHDKAQGGDFDTPSELFESAMQQTLSIATQRQRRGSRTWKQLLDATLRRVQHTYDNKGQLLGHSTGLTSLDEMFHGLEAGKLYIKAGRPAMGKTALALNMALALSRTHTVAICSLEMPEMELAQRLLSMQSQVPGGRLKNGALGDDDIDRLLQATKTLAQCHIAVDDTAAQTIPQMRTFVARLNADKTTPPVGALIVDYLQLIGMDKSIRSREQQVADASRQLKELAKAYEIPVICLAQLNRDCEKRPDKRPLLSDLRESGSIEQDADVVMLLYRDEYYNENTEDRGVAEVIIAKHRGGPTGTVKLRWRAECTRFEAIVGGY